MPIAQIIFYLFALLLVFSSLLVISSRNPVYAVLYLILAFFASSVIWMMLQAEFLALILILVYVGAVMTLFIFVVMLLNLKTLPRVNYTKSLPLGVLISALIVGAMLYASNPRHFELSNLVVPAQTHEHYSNVTELGMVLYTKYVYAFELAAVLLIIAIIASISVTLRKPRAKTQNTAAQLHVDPNKRLRMVNMPAEKTRE